MPLNQTKTYAQLLEIEHMTPTQRHHSLDLIFKRDIENNNQFRFMGKSINPNKLDDDKLSLEVLFNHLTRKEGQENKSREFDIHRSKRLHWIKPHVTGACNQHCKIFSCLDRNQANKRDENRTYIYNESEKYLIVLRPYRENNGYYLLSAYYLDGRDPEKINKKYKRRLPTIL